MRSTIELGPGLGGAGGRSGAATGAAAGLTHEVLTSADEVAARCGEWDRIVDEEYDGNPFMTLDWHGLWLRHATEPGVGVRYVVVRRAGGEDVGYFPCVLRTRRYYGVPLTVLEYMGDPYTPVTCPVIRRAAVAEVTEYFVRGVLPAMRWTAVRAHRLPPEMPGTGQLEESLRAAGVPFTSRMREWPSWAEANWVWDGPGVDSAAYFARLPAHIRRDMRVCPRRLAARGEMRFEMVTAGLTERHVRDYWAIWGRSWKAPERYPEFYPALMRLAARRGWLRMGFLYVGERPVAVEMGLLRQGRGYLFRCAYDEEFRHASAGTTLMWRVVQHCMDHDGMRYFDCLRGDDRYKKYWCNVRRERRTLLAFRPGVVGRALHLVKTEVVPRVRRLRG